MQGDSGGLFSAKALGLTQTCTRHLTLSLERQLGEWQLSRGLAFVPAFPSPAGPALQARGHGKPGCAADTPRASGTSCGTEAGSKGGLEAGVAVPRPPMHTTSVPSLLTEDRSGGQQEAEEEGRLEGSRRISPKAGKALGSCDAAHGIKDQKTPWQKRGDSFGRVRAASQGLSLQGQGGAGTQPTALLSGPTPVASYQAAQQ